MVAKRFFAGIFLSALACGCGTEGGGGGTGPYHWPPAEVSGRVHLRAALRAGDATFQGYRVIIDANGVPVDLTFGSTLVASTQTTGGAYHFTEDHALPIQDYLVRTVVATALADSAVAIYLGTEVAPDTLRLFSDEATQVVPNPFDGQADLHVEVPTAERVVVEARSLSGGLVRKLLDTTLAPGLHAIRWDGANDAGAQVPYGLYWIVTTLGAVQHAELAIRSP
jgi:flagellar hook capping protein FlgD